MNTQPSPTTRIRTRTETDRRVAELVEPAPSPTTALDRQVGSGFVRAVPSEEMQLAIDEYRRIQNVLDRALPDCMMTIQGRSFRKKNYWRAIANAFNLTIEIVSEEIELETGVVLVVARATAPNGRSAIGDGACVAAEKRKGQDTIHNIRGHAHTRAINRAVSNLVGFGEVSAEEVAADGTVGDEHRFPSIAEVRQAIGRALKNGWTREEVREALDHHDATFTNENGTERLAGIPEGEREPVIAVLGGKPPRAAAKPKPAPASEPAKAPDEEPAAEEPARATYPEIVDLWLGATSDDLGVPESALIAIGEKHGIDFATADEKALRALGLKLAKGGSLRGELDAITGPRA